MAAKEQLTAMEMIWGFMSGTTGHMGKTDFAPSFPYVLSSHS